MLLNIRDVASEPRLDPICLCDASVQEQLEKDTSVQAQAKQAFIVARIRHIQYRCDATILAYGVRTNALNSSAVT